MADKTSLLDITRRIQQAHQDVEEVKDLGLPTDIPEEELKELHDSLVKKTRNIDFYIDKIEAEEAQFESVIAAYKTIIKAYENKLKALSNRKKGVMGLFYTTGLVDHKKPYKSDFHTYYLKPTQVVEMVDKDAITTLPNIYKRQKITVEANLSKIKEDLLAGKEVPGFELRDNNTVIRR